MKSFGGFSFFQDNMKTCQFQLITKLLLEELRQNLLSLWAGRMSLP
jgi:hypothetical protein